MDSGGLMQLLAYCKDDEIKNILDSNNNNNNDDNDIIKNLNLYIQMDDDELIKNNEKIVNYISSNCFIQKQLSQNILERLCKLNLEFYAYKLHLLYFSIVVDNKIIFDKFIEENIEITNEIVSFAYHNMYMLERLLRRIPENTLQDTDKKQMWKKFISQLNKLYENDNENFRKMYLFYKNKWNMKLEFFNIMYLLKNNKNSYNIKQYIDIFEILDKDINFHDMSLVFLQEEIIKGNICDYSLCIEKCNSLWSNEDICNIKSQLNKTIEYIKNKFIIKLNEIIDDKKILDNIDDDIYDLFTFIEDYEDNDFYIDFDCDSDSKSISYEKNKDKFDELKTNFDTIFYKEYNQYFTIHSKLESICTM